MRIPLYLLIPLFIIGGGLYAIPYQISLSSMNLMSAVCGVFLFAMVFSLPGAWIQRGHFVPGRKSIAGVVAVALFGIAANYALSRSLETSSATLFIVIARTEIVMAMILGWLFLKEKVTVRLWIGVVVVMIGMILMKSEDLSIPLDALIPVVWAFACAFFFALIQIVSKAVIHLIDPQVLNVSRLVIASTLLLGSEEIRNELSGLTYSQWSMLALAAFFGPFLGRVTYTYSLKYMTISKAMLLGMLSPVLTIVVEYHLYGTLISPSEMGGSLLIILGIVWSFLPTLLNKSS